MKKLLMSLLLSIPIASIAQVAPIPAKSNTLVVSGIGSNEDAWRAVGKSLAAAGFAIKTSSKDFYTLTTEPKDIGKGQQIVITAATKDSLTIFTATMFTPGLGSSPVDYRGMSNSPAKRAWVAFETAIKSVGGSYRGEKR